RSRSGAGASGSPPERSRSAAGASVGLPERSRSSGDGRGAVARIARGPSTALVLKKYRRGGALGGFLPDVFPGWGRMAADLTALERARARSVPCVAAAALILERVPPFFWRGYLLTEEITGSITLDRALAEAPRIS